MSFSVPFEFHKGDRLDGMTVVTPLVRGGYGDLYLVQDEVQLNRILKVIRRPDDDGEFAGIEKCRAVSSHIPGLVPILKVGKLPDGRVWCAMPPADNLAQWPDYEPDTLAGRIAKNGRILPDEVLRTADRLLTTIRELHEAGLAHCDIKPENILFFDGEPKLTDYSLLSSATPGRPDSASFGTIGFVPPEMIRNPGSYDPKACDLYALGKTIYCAWSGADAILFPSVPREIPLQEIGVMLPLYMKACGNSPRERFQNADEFTSAVAQARSRVHSRILTYGKAFFRRYAWTVLLLLLLVSCVSLLLSGTTVLSLFQRLAGRTPADPLTVTTVSDVVDPDDGMISLGEALEYARIPEEVRTIRFNMPDGDSVRLNDPARITRFMRFAPINEATGNPATIELDQLIISDRKKSSAEHSIDGGAVLFANTGHFLIRGGRYAENKDHGDGGKGGAFRMSDCFLIMDGTVFFNNYAYSSGGAVFLERVQATIQDSSFRGNFVCGFGGAIYLSDCPEIVISDTEFINNGTEKSPEFRWSGGAIHIESSNLVYEVTDGTAIRNEGNRSGCGGFIALSVLQKNLPEVSSAEFRIDGRLTVGNNDGMDSFSSTVKDTIASYEIFIRKTGKGVMTVSAPVGDYDGQWRIEDGVLAFDYAGGGDFDGEIVISGGTLSIEAPYIFKRLTFRPGNGPNGRPFIHNFSNLSGGALVFDSANAAEGAYPLADGAAGFDGTISVQGAPGEPPAKLSIGKTAHIGDSDFSLNLSDGMLTLTVRKSSLR